MKVDFLINKMSGGGAERVVSLLANYLVQKGLSIRIITFTGDDNYELDSRIKRIKLHSHPLFHSVVINGFFSLLSFYKNKNNRPDIISSHINLLGYLTIPIARIYNLKLIVSEHNNHYTKSTFAKKILWNNLYPLASAVTILTQFDQEYFSKRNKNVWLMPNPCTFQTVKENDIKFSDSKEILAIGDVNRYDHKGFDNLIYIAKSVLTKHPDWTFKIVGKGDDGITYLKKLSEELGIKDNIVFTGYRTDIKNLLLNTEIFVLPSRYEGLPMTLLEAMSQGVCCIAFDCISGPSDIITHGENGSLVENQNIDDMVLKLNELISSPEKRKQFKLNASKALDKFSIENVGHKWTELIEQVTKS
ncbi:glycosyltransferase family 4 protein [Zobellia uliginosa]|uniref:glycosyltransferase family 4 protein n=1 Tax=Zobellia uliginosa TaxID=143224 RepID=UPI001C07A089|nr:glycosyltransferase family 4 protein [Zobellia uliginosa]MBU2945655.1 glycosyltransferase family 4 protein [Zobellia uliginosa]